MIDSERILELSQRIARQFAPERIILFGSPAYGAPGEGSDVDLLVIMPYTGHSARKAAEISARLQAARAVGLDRALARGGASAPGVERLFLA